LLFLGGALLFQARQAAPLVDVLPVELVTPPKEASALASRPRASESASPRRVQPAQPDRPRPARRRPPPRSQRQARSNTEPDLAGPAAPAHAHDNDAAAAWRALLTAAFSDEAASGRPTGGTGHGPILPGGGPAPSQKRGSSEEVAPPRTLRTVAPDYPTSARRRRAEGLALIRVHVGRRGEVLDAQLARTSGEPDLDRSALEAARSWRFRPGRRGDQPVEAWVRVPVRFRLEAGTL
jgi:protein TonB